MKVGVLLVGLCLMQAYVTIVEVPNTGDLPGNLEWITVASGDWWGRHVDDLIAACGDPQRTIDLVNGGRKLVYRVPLYRGWSLSADNPSLNELQHAVAAVREAENPAGTAAADRPESRLEVIGKLSLVFETSENDRIVGITVAQKFKKRFRPAD